MESSEFKWAAVEFMQKHMHVFDEADENKLEYTTIFEEYVVILEGSIDSKLYQHYSEQQIKAFYNDFKDNFAQYQSINTDVVETLFGFTDFNKFKKQMLEVKTTTAKEDAAVNASASGNHYVISEATFWENHNCQKTTAEGWEKKLEHKGNTEILMHQKVLKMGDKQDYLNCSILRFKGISKNVLMEFFNNMDKHN